MPVTSQVKPRVLLIQRILPHYRIPVFQALARSEVFSFTIAYGLAAKKSALVSITDVPDINSKTLYNRAYGRNRLLVLQLGVSKLVMSGDYDTLIVEFNPRILTNIGAVFQAKLRGMKVIWWGHGIRPNSSKLAVRIYAFLTRYADALLFYTQDGADKFVKLGIPEAKMFVAWNSIDTTEIDSLRKPVPVEERFRIISIGQLIADKKNDLLVRGFQAALSKLPEKTVLTFIGDGPERPKLANLAEELGIAHRVEFTGGLFKQEEIAPYFNAAWLSVSSGYIGLSAIHSLAYGVPMLVADKEPHSPEIAAIEDGKNALFFAANDSDDLATQLGKIAADLELQRSMSEAALATIRHRFNIDTMAAAFDKAVSYANGLPLAGAPRPE